MISAALLLLSQSLFFSLHLAGNPGSFPQPLSAQEEQECLDRWSHGDLEARNRLVEHNLRLVAHIIKKYYTQSDNQDDLISIGTIGLIKAVNTFRSDKNIRLATYASRCIEKSGFDEKEQEIQAKELAEMKLDSLSVPPEEEWAEVQDEPHEELQEER